MIDNKVILVTGGCGLIGRNFIKAITGAGGVAVIADIDPEAGARAVSDLALEGIGKVDFVEMDITNETSIEMAISKLNDSYGKIDALVNSAYPRNKNYGRSFYDVKYSDFCENMGLNLGGYFLTSQKFAKYFTDQGYGNIINISSIYGVIAPKFEVYEGTKMTMPVEYAAIKSGLIHLTKYMAKYFKGENIRVNAISPGGIVDGQPEEFLKAYGEQCMTKGMLEAKDIEGTLLFLLSDLSQYINGQNIIVDDGFGL